MPCFCGVTFLIVGLGRLVEKGIRVGLTFSSFNIPCIGMWIPIHCATWEVPHIFFINLFVGRHLCYFHIMAVVNNATVPMGIQVSLQYLVFIFCEFIPRSRTGGSCGSSTFNFRGASILCSIVAAPAYNPTSSSQRKVPFSLYSLQCLLFLSSWGSTS